MNFPILSTLIFMPIVLSVFVLLARSGRQAKVTAVIISAVSFALSLLMLANFDYNLSLEQFSEQYSWIKALNIEYFVVVDGLSLALVLITTLLSLLAIIYSPSKIENAKVYFACFLVLQGLATGLFCAFDGVLFYLFFDSMLIPMFIIIGLWGGEKRIYATFKLFLYTLFGSVLFLVALIYIGLQLDSFNLLIWSEKAPEVLTLLQQKWLFAAVFIAFAIKVPMVGLHTWLPTAHVQAPTAGSVMLAGVLLKIGSYAMLRFLIPVLPAATAEFAQFVMFLSVIGIIYASFIAYGQTNIKKVIAYSSIAHMGFITLGIFALTELAIQGSIMQMINHAIVSAGLFFAIGVIDKRLRVREYKNLGSLAKKMPKFAFCVMVLTLASIGLPATGNFAGEITILMGAFSSSAILTILAIGGILLSACYMLKFYYQVFYKQNGNVEKLKLIEQLNAKEGFIFAILISLVFVLGFMPNLVFDLTEMSVKNILM